MPRILRTIMLSLGVLLLASCNESRELMSPQGDTHGLSAPVSVVQGGSDGGASSSNGNGSNAGNNGNYDEDRLPSDLDAVASFTTPSQGNGAQQVSAIIGSSGGSLRLGDYEIIVPAGAVDAPTRFSIRTFAESNPRKHAIASFLPHRSFDRDVTLRLPFNSTESAGSEDPTILWRDGNSWVGLPTTVTSDGRLEAQTSHFSIYCTRFSGFTLAGG